MTLPSVGMFEPRTAVRGRWLSLASSKRDMSAIAYLLRRLVDFEAAWVSHFSEFGDKITLGLAVYHTARSLAIAHERLQQEITIEPEYRAASSKIASVFDAVATERDFNSIRHFVASLTADVLKAARVLRGKLDPLFDQPSIVALAVICFEFENKAGLLAARSWNGSSGLIDSESDDDGQEWSEDCVKPELPDAPSRPAVLRQDDRSILKSPGDGSDQNDDWAERLLHFLYADIEVCAVEICARNIAEYSAAMPILFIVDMARQCSDEARHALMVASIMERQGVRLGDYTYTNAVCTNCLKGSGLAERLAIEQIVAEGNALDGSVISLQVMRKAGFDELADLYEFLIADETVHCGFGNRWLLWLTCAQRTEFEKVIDSVLAKTGLTVPGRAPVFEEIRRASGFPEWFIADRLLSASKQ